MTRALRRRLPGCCAPIEGVPEEFWVEVPGLSITVQKHRLGAEVSSGVATGRKCQRRAEHLVARPYAE
jgi:hypothetical protein